MSTQFGKYVLQRKLAEGGMAEVWLAKQSGMEGFEKPVVLKKILPHLTSDARFVEMFVHEARIAARLTHPNIAQIFDLGKVDNEYYIAMEFIHGEDMRSIAKVAEQKNKRPPIQLICRILAEMLGALHYAHTRAGPDGKPLGLVHRDISPQNVLVTYEGGVKLVDFGVAKATQSVSDQQTQAGVLKGKFAYMSPEQCRGKKVDARSDIFAVGILLWELISWKRLFRRDGDLATLVAVADEAIPSLLSVAPEIPPELDQVCMHALARPLEERYQSAQAMQADLETLIRKYAWAADSIKLQHYVCDLFSDKLQAQDEAVRAAGVGSLDDLLAKVEDGEVLAWIDPVDQSGRTPSAMFQRGNSGPHAVAQRANSGRHEIIQQRSHSGQQPIARPVSGQHGILPAPGAMPTILPTPQPVRILPTPQANFIGPAPSSYETSSSTLRNAVGQRVPAPNRVDHITAETGAHAIVAGPPPPSSRAKRLLIILGTSIVIAGVSLFAMMGPGVTGVLESAGAGGGQATIHLELDVEAQVWLDGARQLPGKEMQLPVAPRREHEVRVKRGELERKVTVPPLEPGVTQTVRLKLSE